ncbi:ATP-grasp domain-containing protein [Brevundimonas kwangchunensis]|uniref:ATP-grasp domain-containing protein n=1 Tax=Brevundimonas kwangchunensis TaxID=322163 RepID=A0ABN1GUB7_9CAUL
MAERVLITGARAAAALDLARSLRAAGFEPHLADCSPARLARWSRTAGPVHRYAAPVQTPARFAQDVRALVARLDPVRIIPTCEEVFHLSALAAIDGFANRLFAPEVESLAELHAKDRFAALCRTLGVDAPQTRMAADAADLPREGLEALVLKPVWSRFGARTLVGPTPEQLQALRPSPTEPWVVQQRILGEDVSLYAVCNDGRIDALSVYGSPLRSRGGAALAFRPLGPVQTERLRRMIEPLAAWAGDGQLSFDAVIDAGDRPWLIECNPRATSGVHLFDRSADFGRALMARGHADMADRPRCLGPAVWSRGARGLGEDVLSAPADPLPSLGALVDAAAFACDALRTGRTLTEAMTADIEWNGQPLEPDRWSRT